MKLKDWIESTGISPQQFADEVGTSAASISRYCAEKHIPRPGLMQRIVKATNGAVTPFDFYGSEQGDHAG